jgi:hypothetical protein
MAKAKNLLTLNQREAKLGNSINTWALKMGKTETAPAKSIQIETSISRKELCSILREPLAGESFFNDKAGLAEPLYGGKIDWISIVGEFKDSELRLFVGIDLAEIALLPVTLDTLKFRPLTGGRSTLKFSAQYQPTEGDDLRELERWLAHDVKIAAVIGKIVELAASQPELALNDSSDAVPLSIGEQQANALLDSTPLSDEEIAQARALVKKRVRPSRSKAAREARAAAKSAANKTRDLDGDQHATH